MEPADHREFLTAAAGALPPGEAALAWETAAFVAQRLESAAAERARIGTLLERRCPPEELQRAVHAFLREGWDALDGLGRLVNQCLYAAFPDAGLNPPERMGRRCTFYTVRRALHGDPGAAAHPLGVLLWDETRRSPAPGYARLSFLRNVSVFAPVPIPGGRHLPGSADLPRHVCTMVKPQELEGCPIEAGLDLMLGWLCGFVGECYGLMAGELARRGDS